MGNKTRLVQRWNYQTKSYDDVYVDGEWFTPLYSDDMEVPINCINCGKQISFGESYTSNEYHNQVGFGYYVCEECYEKEWELKNKYRLFEAGEE